MFSNNRGWIFLGIVSLFFLILGQSLFGRQGLLLGFFVASALNLYIYFVSEKILVSFFKAQPLAGQDCWGVADGLKKVCDSFHAPAPHAYITQIDSPIICCTSRGWGRSKIILSEHLLEKLSREEIYQVLMIHVLYILSLNSFFIGFRTQFAEIIFVLTRFLDTILSIPFILTGQETRVSLFQKLFIPVGTLFFESQRKVLLEVDEQAAKMIGSNEKYAQLIWKLQSLLQTKPFATPPSPSLLFMINPLTTDGLEKYFQKHFGLEVRIKNLIGHYPL